jgi:hypothetical protein
MLVAQDTEILGVSARKTTTYFTKVSHPPKQTSDCFSWYLASMLAPHQNNPHETIFR